MVAGSRPLIEQITRESPAQSFDLEPEEFRKRAYAVMEGHKNATGKDPEPNTLWKLANDLDLPGINQLFQPFKKIIKQEWEDTKFMASKLPELAEPLGRMLWRINRMNAPDSKVTDQINQQLGVDEEDLQLGALGKDFVDFFKKDEQVTKTLALALTNRKYTENADNPDYDGAWEDAGNKEWDDILVDAGLVRDNPVERNSARLFMEFMPLYPSDLLSAGLATVPGRIAKASKYLLHTAEPEKIKSLAKQFHILKQHDIDLPLQKSQEVETQVTEQLTKLADTIMPQDAQKYLDLLDKKYRKKAEGFLEKVPDNLKEEYAKKLENTVVPLDPPLQTFYNAIQTKAKIPVKPEATKELSKELPGNLKDAVKVEETEIDERFYTILDGFERSQRLKKKAEAGDIAAWRYKTLLHIPKEDAYELARANSPEEMETILNRFKDIGFEKDAYDTSTSKILKQAGVPMEERGMPILWKSAFQPFSQWNLKLNDPALPTYIHQLAKSLRMSDAEALYWADRVMDKPSEKTIEAFLEDGAEAVGLGKKWDKNKGTFTVDWRPILIRERTPIDAAERAYMGLGGEGAKGATIASELREHFSLPFSPLDLWYLNKTTKQKKEIDDVLGELTKLETKELSKKGRSYLESFWLNIYKSLWLMFNPGSALRSNEELLRQGWVEAWEKYPRTSQEAKDIANSANIGSYLSEAQYYDAATIRNNMSNVPLSKAGTIPHFTKWLNQTELSDKSTKLYYQNKKDPEKVKEAFRLYLESEEGKKAWPQLKGQLLSEGEKLDELGKKELWVESRYQRLEQLFNNPKDKTKVMPRILGKYMKSGNISKSEFKKLSDEFRDEVIFPARMTLDQSTEPFDQVMKGVRKAGFKLMEMGADWRQDIIFRREAMKSADRFIEIAKAKGKDADGKFTHWKSAEEINDMAKAQGLDPDDLAGQLYKKGIMSPQKVHDIIISEASERVRERTYIFSSRHEWESKLRYNFPFIAPNREMLSFWADRFLQGSNLERTAIMGAPLLLSRVASEYVLPGENLKFRPSKVTFLPVGREAFNPMRWLPAPHGILQGLAGSAYYKLVSDEYRSAHPEVQRKLEKYFPGVAFPEMNMPHLPRTVMNFLGMNKEETKKMNTDEMIAQLSKGQTGYQALNTWDKVLRSVGKSVGFEVFKPQNHEPEYLARQAEGIEILPEDRMLDPWPITFDRNGNADITMLTPRQKHVWENKEKSLFYLTMAYRGMPGELRESMNFKDLNPKEYMLAQYPVLAVTGVAKSEGNGARTDTFDEIRRQFDEGLREYRTTGEVFQSIVGSMEKMYMLRGQEVDRLDVVRMIGPNGKKWDVMYDLIGMVRGRLAIEPNAEARQYFKDKALKILENKSKDLGIHNEWKLYQPDMWLAGVN